jgi:Ca2+-binding EF-hand superfamily protein
MKKATTSLFIVAALTMSSLALAGGHHKRGGHMFKRLDLNNDGKITKAEASQARTKWFAMVDTNKDGTITQAEAQKGKEARKGQHIEEMFKRLDKNKDGRITKQESDLPEKRFSKLDKNNDGAITKAEVRDAHASHAGKRGHGGKGKGAHHFARMDQNKDGKVTKAEAEKAGAELFKRADKNNDGAVTMDEARAAFKGHHDRRGSKKS